MLSAGALPVYFFMWLCIFLWWCARVGSTPVPLVLAIGSAGPPAAVASDPELCMPLPGALGIVIAPDLVGAATLASAPVVLCIGLVVVVLVALPVLLTPVPVVLLDGLVCAKAAVDSSKAAASAESCTVVFMVNPFGNDQ